MRFKKPPSCPATMTTRAISVRELTNCELTVDGNHFQLGFIDGEGKACFLSLPSDCLKSLIMTLPQAMERALQIRYRDNSLRLVFRAHRLRIELASDRETFIATLTTQDGFAVSFTLDDAQMLSFADALAAREAAAATAPKTT
jgi:hypothetical protein